MAYIRGTDRDQIVLFPESIDDYITEDNPVQFIDVFVDSLDLSVLGFKYAQTKTTGRPPYSPADMLKLFIYGYLNRIRSSRKLEKEAGRNVELMWLLRKLSPDFKTIADFRKDNTSPIKAVCREFTLLAKKLDLFGAELVAIDGSKFKANNSKKQNFTKKKLEKLINGIEERIDEYLSDIETADREEAATSTPTAEELKGKIASLKKRKDTYQGLLSEMKETGTTEVSLTDPDARSMMNNGKIDICYNIQTSVDAKHKLILDYDVINEPADNHQLSKMALRSQELLEVSTLEVLADKGYYDAREIKTCADAGIVPYIPKAVAKGGRYGLYHKDRFSYDAQTDTYTCPAGCTLTFMKKKLNKGKVLRLYVTEQCLQCHVKNNCTYHANGRIVTRWEHEELLDAMHERVLTNMDKMRQRQCLSEHPFGTIKRSFDQGYMLLKGIKKVGTEVGLSVLVYNIKRAINIIGIRDLIAAVT